MVFSSKAVLAFLLVNVAEAGRIGGSPGHKGKKGFVRSLEFNHRLRVCNAYPYDVPMDIYKGPRDKITADEPLPYKSCRDFSSPLKPGDKLAFKVGNMDAGMFAISDLPNNDAFLMLVIHRHDTLTNAVSFESHVFATLVNAQVAVIDTYKGHARATPEIVDADSLSGVIDGKGVTRTEKLRFRSVVALNQGMYGVKLQGADGKNIAEGMLVALDKESYVVLRTGVESEQGKSYPQALVVYPQSDAALLRSSSRLSAGLGSVAVFLAVMATICA